MIPFSYLAFVEAGPLNPMSTTPNAPVVNAWPLAGSTNDSYLLVEYAPTIAPVRRSRLGGSGTYAEVIDTLTLHVTGGTASECVTNLERLIGVLDQAARWARFEPVNPIQIRAQVRQGTAGELAAVILGPESDEPPAEVDPEFDELLGLYIIRNVTLRFIRRGLWNAVPPFQFVSSPLAAHQVRALTLVAGPAPAPVTLALSTTATPEYAFLASGSRLLFGTAAADFTIVEAESLATTSFTSVASNLARGGAYASLIGTGAMIQSLKTTIPAVSRADLYAVMNNSSDVTITVQLSDPRYETFSSSGTSVGLVQVTTVVPASGVGNPTRPVYLGRVDTITPLTRLWLQMTGPNTGAEVAQIDTIVVHRDAGIGTGALTLLGGAAIPYGADSTRLNPLTIDAGALNLPAPAVYQSEYTLLSEPFASLSYAGDPYLESVGQTIAVLPLLCAPPEFPLITNPNGMFVPQTTVAGGTAVTFRLVVRRPLSYRTPQ